MPTLRLPLPGFLRAGQLRLLGLALWLALWPAQPVWAQGGPAIVRPEPKLLNVGQGQVETLEILLENAQDVYGIDVRASFDPAVVEVVDADPSRDGIQMTPGSFVKPDFMVRNVADNEAGTLQYVITQVNPSEPVTGTGVILSVQFRGKVLGQQSELTIGFVEIADRRGVKLSVQGQNGALAVVQPKPPTPAPVPSATPVPPASPTAPPTRTAVPQRADTPTVPTVAAAATTVAARSAASGGLLSAIAVVAFAAAALVLGAAVVLLRRRSDPSSGRRSPP
jgi:hypothetical protein